MINVTMTMEEFTNEKQKAFNTGFTKGVNVTTNEFLQTAGVVQKNLACRNRQLEPKNTCDTETTTTDTGINGCETTANH